MVNTIVRINMNRYEFVVRMSFLQVMSWRLMMCLRLLLMRMMMLTPVHILVVVLMTMQAAWMKMLMMLFSRSPTAKLCISSAQKRSIMTWLRQTLLATAELRGAASDTSVDCLC